MPEKALHESPEVRTRAVLAIVAGVLAALVAIAFGFQLLFPDRIGKAFAVRNLFPAPEVIPNERAERLALEARQRRELEGADGHMKVEDAMAAIARRGNRAFDPVGGTP